MSGASWSDRQPSDWLASNGRWYDASKYPRGWSTTALPPAPGHGGVESLLGRFVGTGSAPSPTFTPSDEVIGHHRAADHASSWTVDGEETATSDDSVASESRPPGSAVVPTGRRVEDATLSESDRRGPTPAIPAPAGRLSSPPPSRSLPAPPSVPNARPNLPAPPAPRSAAPAAPQPPAPSDASDQGGIEVVAGDLGRVLGTAKRRIERAINEAAEQ